MWMRCIVVDFIWGLMGYKRVGEGVKLKTPRDLQKDCGLSTITRAVDTRAGKRICVK